MAELIYVERALDANGDTVTDATAYFYEDGTSTPLTVYTDNTLGTPRGTSVAFDSEGVCPPCWVANNTGIKIDVQDGAAVSLPGYPIDNAGRFPEGGADLDNTAFDPITGNNATDGQTAIANNTARVNQLDQSFYLKTSTGSGGSFAITAQYTIAAYAEGQMFRFVANHDALSTNTLNVDGVGAIALKKYLAGTGKTDVNTQDFITNDVVTALYDGTHFVCWIQPGGIATTTRRGPVESGTLAELKSAATNRHPTTDVVNQFVGLQLISSQDLSSAATADFTGFDASIYEGYVFRFSNVVPASDSVTFTMRTSSDTGSSYDAGASDYAWNYSGYTSGAATPIGADAADSEIEMTGNVGSDTNETGVCGSIEIHGPHLTQYTQVSGAVNFVNPSGDLATVTCGGVRLSAADVDAVRFLFSSGNIESGTITMYGVRAG